MKKKISGTDTLLVGKAPLGRERPWPPGRGREDLRQVEKRVTKPTRREGLRKKESFSQGGKGDLNH